MKANSSVRQHVALKSLQLDARGKFRNFVVCIVSRKMSGESFNSRVFSRLPFLDSRDYTTHPTCTDITKRLTNSQRDAKKTFAESFPSEKSSL